MDRLPPGATEQEGTDEETDVENREGPMVCARCGAHITHPDHLFQMGDDAQVFANPHGIVYELLTAHTAMEIVAMGSATTEFTWFPGYAWRVLHCGSCQVHIGWVFDATQPTQTPQQFFGLLKERLKS